jgi:hypothetical protein
MTLSEIEAIAARLAAACATFREARQILGGGSAVSSIETGNRAAAPVSEPSPQLRPDELARRQMLLEQFPKEIQEAERAR